MQIHLQHKSLSAIIDTYGAQLISLCKNGEEYIWQRDPSFWPECCPILFPLVSSVKNNQYTYQGKTYTIPKHGFARRADFSVTEQSEAAVTLRLIQTEEIAASYPFSFDFSVSFDLSGGKLDCAYTVVNTSTDETMYFNTGAHEGYQLFDGGNIEDHYIVFEQPEHLVRRFSNQIDLFEGKIKDFGITDRFDLEDTYFLDDAVFFLDLKSRFVTLCSKTSDKRVRVTFDARNLGIWKKPGASYVCIEPWDGFCETAWSDGQLDHKERIQILAPSCTHVVRHSVEIL